MSVEHICERLFCPWKPLWVPHLCVWGSLTWTQLLPRSATTQLLEWHSPQLTHTTSGGKSKDFDINFHKLLKMFYFAWRNLKLYQILAIKYNLKLASYIKICSLLLIVTRNSNNLSWILPHKKTYNLGSNFSDTYKATLFYYYIYSNSLISGNTITSVQSWRTWIRDKDPLFHMQCLLLWSYLLLCFLRSCYKNVAIKSCCFFSRSSICGSFLVKKIVDIIFFVKIIKNNCKKTIVK